MTPPPASEHPFTPEVRIYWPEARTSAPLSHRHLIGTQVHVAGWFPYFNRVGSDLRGEPLHEARFFGHVLELDMKIPEAELIRPIPIRKPTT